MITQTNIEQAQPNYLSIKALTQYLKRKFDVDPYLRQVWVIGEISNFRLRPNSHQYFSLKDDAARISAVMYRHQFNKLAFKPEEGMKVVAMGRISLYEPTGTYQLTIESLQPDGVGALYQALEQLKAKLAQEGLFNQPKQALVKFPRKIAVITSPSGAVIRDILTTIKRRYPIVGVTVFPTKVQGSEAAAEIVAAFRQVEAMADEFDTIILARGGGSIEDLWPFNEEAVARAIAASSLPVISSVGHETDTTIADLVADLRAPTPTAAAELAVPVLAEVLRSLNQFQNRLLVALQGQLRVHRRRLERVNQSYVLEQPQRVYQPYLQELDKIQQRLMQAQHQYLVKKVQSHALLNSQLFAQQPTKQIQEAKQALIQIDYRLKNRFPSQLEANQKYVDKLISLLDAYSPLKIMQRGYAIVSQDKRVVLSAKEVEIGQTLSIQFHDGQTQAQVTAVRMNKTS
ncbi:exodeoxyribonuclease VII large subunit [Vaginisenegalia massiliensis]|uniref:exodeoxyribonuclease VII large subunit n=1 Tax=Vaginisenegalia massiliensis TaxID=2058294 RepID=UPI000F51CEBC|nr:exodeoxyribonuclease VII large subunit [Vaginisenegalia massiliensis]